MDVRAVTAAGCDAERVPSRAEHLPRLIQRAALAGLTAVSRRGLDRRRDPLPPLGEVAHLSAVVRLGASAVPTLTARQQHYVYPPETVHVTVSSLDAATVDVPLAVRRLADVHMPTPTFRVAGLGCSPDTLFLRCIHDKRFTQLRLAVEQAFGVPPASSPRSWVFRRLSFANVVRFDGSGEWQQISAPSGDVQPTVLEIVRTDRYLSVPATTVLDTITLSPG